jgi:hypothetical protein
MSDFICTKCNATFTDSNKLKRHLDRKTPCTNEKKSCICQYCSKAYSKPYNCRYHELNSCPLNVEALKERIKKHKSTTSEDTLIAISNLKEKTYEVPQPTATLPLKKLPLPVPTTTTTTSSQAEQTVIQQHITQIENQTNIETQNNIQNNIENQMNIENVNVHIEKPVIQYFVLPFGKENTDHITPEYVLSLYDESKMLSAIPKLIHNIHLNKQLPENMNFVLTNDKDGIVKYKAYEDEWREVTSEEVTDNLIDDKHMILESFYQSNKSTLKKEQVKNYKELQTNMNRGKDYRKYLQKKIIDFFITSKETLETIMKMDESKIADGKQLKQAINGYKSAMFAFEHLVETKINPEVKDITDEEIYNFIQNELAAAPESL